MCDGSSSRSGCSGGRPGRATYYAPPVGSGSVVRVFGIELNRIAPAVRGGTAWLADADSTVTTPAAMPSSVVPTDSLATRFRITVLGVVRDFGGGHGATLPASNLAVDVSQSSFLICDAAGAGVGRADSRQKRSLVDRPPDVRDGRSDRRTPVGSASQMPNVQRTRRATRRIVVKTRLWRESGTRADAGSGPASASAGYWHSR